MEEFHLLVSLPSDLATLALIILLPADGANARYARGAAEDVLTCSARSLRLWQLDAVRKVNSLQPGGGPLVAYSASQDPTGHAAVHVVCHKNTVVATFRALAALKQQLQLKVSKECICLRLSVQDLQPALQHVLLQTLANAGWSQLSHNFLLRSHFLLAAEGQVCKCESLHINITAQSPSELLLVVQPGVARFRPLSVTSMLGQDTRTLSAATSSVKPAALNARLWGMQMICTMPPDCRPALLAGIKPGCSTAAEEAGLRDAWRLHTGWELPEQIPYIVGVRFSADEDEAVIGVPSCCVWSAGGLAVVPATTRSGTAQAILRRLAGDITGSPFQFWPGKALSVNLLVRKTSGSGGENPQHTAQWTSAKDVQCAATQPKPECADTQLVTLSDVDAPCGEGDSAVTSAGAAQAARRDAVKPSPALQAYLSSLPATEDAGTNRALPKLPAVTAAPGNHNPHVQHAKPKGTNPQLSKIPSGQTSDFAMTAEQQQGPASIGATCDPIAVPNISAPVAAKACVKPTFAGHKRPAGMAGTAARTKAPAQSKPRATPSAKRPPPGKPAALTDAAPVQQGPAGAAMAPNAQQLAPGGDSAAAKAPPRKRTKAQDLDTAQVEVQVRERHAAGQLDKLSIPELKCFLKAHKQAVGGKKADLVARVAELLARAS